MKRPPHIQLNIPPRTLAQVQAFLAKCKKAKSHDSAARLLIHRGNLTPEAYRYAETFLEECPKCGLLHGHRYPCVS